MTRLETAISMLIVTAMTVYLMAGAVMRIME